MNQQPSQPNLTINVEQKTTGVTYLLWLFFGAFGAHQFYLGKVGRAVSMLLTLGWLTIGLWIDLFTIPRQVRAMNEQLLDAARARQATLTGDETDHIAEPTR